GLPTYGLRTVADPCSAGCCRSATPCRRCPAAGVPVWLVFAKTHTCGLAMRCRHRRQRVADLRSAECCRPMAVTVVHGGVLAQAFVQVGDVRPSIYASRTCPDDVPAKVALTACPANWYFSY